MYFLKYIYGLVLTAASCGANDAAHGDQLCMVSCQEAYSYISFADAHSSSNYYVAQCTTPLLLLSIFSCGQKYCTRDEITAGSEYLNYTCRFYGDVVMPTVESILSHHSDYANSTYVLSLDEFHSGRIFNTSVVPGQDLFEASYRTLSTWGFEMNAHDDYGWAMYGFWGGVITIGTANNLWNIWRNYVYTHTKRSNHGSVSVSVMSTTTRMHNWIMARLVYPATFGYRRAQPVGWCTIPPLLESLTIVAFVALNIVLCSVHYRLFMGNLYWPETNQQIWRYLSDRTGIIAFANLPLLWIFGTRNNFLISMTGWDFAMFTSFHRWVARIATLEAVLHSVGYIVETFLESGSSIYYESWKERYWYTGAIATVAMSLMLGLSVYGLRKSAYEVFLALHLGLAVIVLVGCFYHVKIFNGLYNGHLWACMAIWCLDRLLRLIRIGILNIPYKYGQVSFNPDANIVKLEVTTQRSFKLARGSYYFVYILHGWRFWESHPFTAVVHLPHLESISSARKDDQEIHERDDSLSSTGEAGSRTTNKVRFLIRPHDGFTARLRDLVHDTRGALTAAPVRVLIEGPYGHQPRLGQYHDVIFLVGGSGISVALASLQMALHDHRKGLSQPNFHLSWAVKEFALVEMVTGAFAEYRRELAIDVSIYVTRTIANNVESEPSSPTTNHIEVRIRHEKMDIPTTVTSMAGKIGRTMAVVACGPPALADDARRATVAAAQQFGNIEYVEERFTW